MLVQHGWSETLWAKNRVNHLVWESQLFIVGCSCSLLLQCLCFAITRAWLLWSHHFKSWPGLFVVNKWSSHTWCSANSIMTHGAFVAWRSTSSDRGHRCNLILHIGGCDFASFWCARAIALEAAALVGSCSLAHFWAGHEAGVALIALRAIV